MDDKDSKSSDVDDPSIWDVKSKITVVKIDLSDYKENAYLAQSSGDFDFNKIFLT